MPAFALSDRLGDGAELELQEARQSLAYWEDRVRRLPRHAVRRRREAREMVVRWEARVADAERAAYGRGLLGAMLLLLAERKLPEDTRRAGRRVVRRTAQLATVVLVAVVALVVAGAVAALELLAAALDALA